MMAGMLTPTVCEMWPIVGWVFFSFLGLFSADEKAANCRSKNVQKVGYHTEKTRRRPLLPNPTLEVPITWADARGHDALASAQVMGTSESNVGLRAMVSAVSRWLITECRKIA